MTRTEYIEVLKSAFLTAGKNAVMKYLVSRFSFFSLKIINPITAMIVEKLIMILIENAEMGIFFLYTDFRVSEQGKDFEKVAMENSITQRIGTPEQKRISEEKLIGALREFARFNS